MIDISIIQENGKTYSIKSSLFPSEREGAVNLKILYVYEVKMYPASTSFQKIKTIFESNDETKNFDRNKYKSMFNKLTQKLVDKYKITSFVI